MDPVAFHTTTANSAGYIHQEQREREGEARGAGASEDAIPIPHGPPHPIPATRAPTIDHHATEDWHPDQMTMVFRWDHRHAWRFRTIGVRSWY